MRATQVTQIQALTPTSLSGNLFRVFQDHLDFQEWAGLNPQACLRVFTAHDLFQNEIPAVSNSDQELIDGRCEVIVAYPNNFVYGVNGTRDMDDIIEQDMVAIDNVVGHRSTAYTDGSCFDGILTTERGEEVTFLTMSYRTIYYRSV